MKKRIIRYLLHITVTFLGLLIIGFLLILSLGGTINYGDKPQMRNLDKEGPYVFFADDSTFTCNYIRGNKNEGFYLEQSVCPVDSSLQVNCYFPLDSSSFSFSLSSTIETPKTSYQDNHPILAISDVESGYQAFRDFLINNQVIDQDLNWIFGKGHLVLVGDFVDRGYSTTQVLWFIYKLEQAAKRKGGSVHYILGNHELYNLQGKFKSASPKYYGVAAILNKQPHELYTGRSFLGRWLASKNTLERINGNLFVHGGIHPDVAAMDLDIDEINQTIRDGYYQAYYPRTEKSDRQVLTSHRTGIAWYRGYFKEDLTQVQVNGVLDKFNAKSIVVGHTLQSKVNRIFDGKVIAIDVKHPKDYQKNFPTGKSEGLFIFKDKYFRVLANGDKIAL